MDITDNAAILEAIRTAHCDRKNAGHRCVGTTIIEPSGMRLDCKLCGSDDSDRKKMVLSCTVRWMESIFRAAGIDPNSLSADAYVAAAKALENG